VDALPRRLGLGRSVGLGLAAVVGSGIFILPSYVARQLPTPGAFLVVWQIGALVALCSALSYAELATVFPHTGGYVVYLQRIFGRRMAFVYGWAAILVLYPASIAGLARVTGRSVAALVSLPGAVDSIAVLTVIAAVLLNLARLRTSTRVSTGLAAVKVGALWALGLGGLWVARQGLPAAVSDGGGAGTLKVASNGVPAFGAWILALVGVLWCYEGFLEIVVVAGEVRRPGRTLVRALLLVVLAVALGYGIYTFALVRVLGMDGIATSSTVGAQLARSVLPGAGETVIHLVVAIATFSAAQALLFSGPRLVVGLAEGGVVSQRWGRPSRRDLVPRTAILVCGGVSLAYALIGRFEELVKYFAFATGLFSAVILSGGLFLRGRGRVPATARRIPLWPLPPLVAIASALVSSGWVLADQPRSSLIGLGVMALSWPASRWLLSARDPRYPTS